MKRRIQRHSPGCHPFRGVYLGRLQKTQVSRRARAFGWSWLLVDLCPFAIRDCRPSWCLFAMLDTERAE